MKSHLRKGIMLLLWTVLLFSSCNKPHSDNSTPPVPIACNNRPVINARLVQIGYLPGVRSGLVSATVGTKIFFAGGSWYPRVDIYDTVTKTWSTAESTILAREQGVAVATVGNKILFAGGGNHEWLVETTSRVDIYDASNDTWSTAELSKAREYMAVATLGNKVFFAGGGSMDPQLIGSNVVDIYDNSTNTWTVSALSIGRMDLSATTVGNKIYFAGGMRGYGSVQGISNTIDIYDGGTNSWSTSSLQEPRSHMASIAVGNNIYWAGGFNSHILGYSGNVEIRDVATGVSSFACMIPRTRFSAVAKDDKIIFFTGKSDNPYFSGTHFEIYNTTTQQWSTGLLNKKITGATIIAVNDMIFVAGGGDIAGGLSGSELWKLEF